MGPCSLMGIRVHIYILAHKIFDLHPSINASNNDNPLIFYFVSRFLTTIVLEPNVDLECWMLTFWQTAV